MLAFALSGAGLHGVAHPGKDDFRLGPGLPQGGLQGRGGNDHQQIGMIGLDGGHNTGKGGHITLGIIDFQLIIPSFLEARLLDAVNKAVMAALGEFGFAVQHHPHLPGNATGLAGRI